MTALDPTARDAAIRAGYRINGSSRAMMEAAITAYLATRREQGWEERLVSVEDARASRYRRLLGDLHKREALRTEPPVSVGNDPPLADFAGSLRARAITRNWLGTENDQMTAEIDDELIAHWGEAYTEGYRKGMIDRPTPAAIVVAVQAEREACVQLVAAMGREDRRFHEMTAAIRARSTPEQEPKL